MRSTFTVILTIGLSLSCLLACSSSEDVAAPEANVEAPSQKNLTRRVGGDDAKGLVLGVKDRSPQRTQELESGYYYYEEGKRKPLWLDRQRLAEFRPNDDQASRIQAECPQALPGEGSSSTRLWSVPGWIGASSIVDNVARHDGMNLSAVFLESSSRGGRERALPGGIIVRFGADWTHRDVERWAQEQGTPIVRQMRSSKGTYVLHSAPGLASLELANTLQESDLGVSATPVFWVGFSQR